MHLQTLQRAFSVFLVLCLPVLAFGQGLTWESTTVMKMAGDRQITSKSCYLPRMFKQGTEKEATVFRLDKQVMYTINYEKKEYTEMTFAELESYVGKANAAVEGKMAELKKRLADMPEDQRKAMEQMMGAQLGQGDKEAKIEVTKSPETKTISGFPCVNYVLTQDGKEVGNFWTTTQVPGFDVIQKDFKEFSGRLASQMTTQGPQMAEAMKKVEGFPIQSTIGGMMTATVNSVGKAAVSPGEFEVPAGFKKVDFNPMERMQENGPPRGNGRNNRE